MLTKREELALILGCLFYVTCALFIVWALGVEVGRLQDESVNSVDNGRGIAQTVSVTQ